jgi:hypothetical protein
VGDNPAISDARRTSALNEVISDAGREEVVQFLDRLKSYPTGRLFPGGRWPFAESALARYRHAG